MRVQRLKNPIRDLTREQKIVIGVGVGTVLALGTLATVAWASKSDPPMPKRPIDIGPGCASYAIASQQQLHDDLRVRLREAAKLGPIDPLQLTARYIKSQAPGCQTYPANTDNPGQVKLFAEIYLQLLDVMQQDNYLAPADFPTWYQMMTTWAAGQDVAIEDL